jgi:hypothetical protein
MSTYDLASLLKDSFNSFVKQIQIGLPCKITKFDKEMMRADVQPFLKQSYTSDDDTTTETQYPIIPNIPVMFINAGDYYIRPPYKIGDMVWVGFSSRNIDTSLDEYSRVEAEALFSMENACVLGSIVSNKFTPPTEFTTEDGLIIGEKNGNSYIVFEADNVTFKFIGGTIETKFDSQGMSYGTTGSTLHTLQLHTHPTGGPGAPTSPPTIGT